jgi:hypothetical protein
MLRKKFCKCYFLESFGRCLFTKIKGDKMSKNFAQFLYIVLVNFER